MDEDWATHEVICSIAGTRSKPCVSADLVSFFFLPVPAPGYYVIKSFFVCRRLGPRILAGWLVAPIYIFSVASSLMGSNTRSTRDRAMREE
ncbi:hypothetical protein FB451DRAFT_1260618 [Mycena latifolia]|nr:hypothetical protein FB451DRAFT_1260618 [Mycena latifolia]